MLQQKNNNALPDKVVDTMAYNTPMSHKRPQVAANML